MSKNDYIIISDATADLSSKMLSSLPNVEIIPMDVKIEEKSYLYGPNGNLSADKFYKMQRSGMWASTTQITPLKYFEFFKQFLDKGLDVLYLCFSSGMSGTYGSSQIAVRELQELYPGRKIISIDTLCASTGQALFVYEAGLKQIDGMPMEELAAWLEENRLKMCHWFTVDHLDHLMRGGRISAATAAVGTMLQVKPLLHLNDIGKLEVVEKPRGRKKAMATQIGRMESGWLPEISHDILIGHGGNSELAEKLKELVEEKFPDADVYTAPIGPIIGSHTGPDMLSICYWGSNR